MTESFSTRLNDAMALRELKQIDFVHAAEKFNIKLGKSHMSQYVSGKTVPRADIAHFLAAYLRVNEDWLMGKDVPMEEHAAILPDFAGEQPDHQVDNGGAGAHRRQGVGIDKISYHIGIHCIVQLLEKFPIKRGIENQKID